MQQAVAEKLQTFVGTGALTGVVAIFSPADRTQNCQGLLHKLNRQSGKPANAKPLPPLDVLHISSKPYTALAREGQDQTTDHRRSPLAASRASRINFNQDGQNLRS